MSHKGASGGELTISLDAPGMTSLHRVGVAGLWMTLQALDGEPGLKEQVTRSGGTWERTSRAAILRWSGDASAFFEALVEVSFRLDAHGLVEFTALGTAASNAHRVLLQNALLETFLQHGKTREAGAPTLLVSGDDDGREPLLAYRPLRWYAHRRAAKNLRPGKMVPLAGWNLPGGAVRHSGFTAESALSEPLDRYLALLYAPVGVFFFRLLSRRQRRKPRFCLVLPDVLDLPRYAHARREFSSYFTDRFIAAGGADASLRVALLLRTENLLDRLRASNLRAIEFGRVAWDTKQKYRVGLFEVTDADAKDLEWFRRAQQVFAPRVVTAGSDLFWSAPQIPELIAANVANGQPWWKGFSQFVHDVDRRKAVFGFERKGLAQMTTSLEQHSGMALGDNAAEIFVHACHAAWRRRLAALFERARSEQLNAADLIGREFEAQRITFARCKNAATLRAAITDFWARGGGSLGPLQTGWKDVLPFLTEPRWQEGRDLALLALASYSAATRQEADVLDTPDTSSAVFDQDPEEEL